MLQQQQTRTNSRGEAYVIGPTGAPLTLKDLPPEQAELLRMAYFEDKPHSVISAENGIPLGTVKSRLRLAMERLRRSLKDVG